LKNAKSDNLLLFLLVTLGWTWYTGFLPLFFGLGDTAAGDTLFKLIAGPVPSFVALALVFATYSKEQKRDYFRRVVSIRQMGLMWPLLTMAFFAVILGVSIFVSVFFLGGEPPGFGGVRAIARSPHLILLYLFFALVSGPLNEEFGWRGFALDKLFARRGFWAGSAILGFVWGIWHLPWYFYPGNGQYIFWHLSPIHGIMYIASTITLSCVISIVYVKTNRSILSAFFVHMISNFFTSGQLIYPFGASYMIALLYVTIALQATVILCFMRSAKFRLEIEEKLAALL